MADTRGDKPSRHSGRAESSQADSTRRGVTTEGRCASAERLWRSGFCQRGQDRL